MRPGAPRPARPARGGFTLLELLIVMAILALVAGVVAPSVGLVGDRGGLKTAARRLAGAVHEARTHAARTRTWAELSISGGTRLDERPVTLVVEGRDAEDAAVELGRAELPDDVEMKNILVEGKLPATSASLRFHPRGLTLPAAVRLKRDDRAMTVCIHPVVGVDILDGEASLEQCKREQ